jgi:hypothetical protein
MAIIGLSLAACGLQGLRADITGVSFDSGSQMVFNQASALLTGGTTNDGDGAVLQLGYYSTATAGNNFAGTWTPLSGQTSLNTATIAGSVPAEQYNHTSIGDLNVNGAGNGTFAISLNFNTLDSTSNNNLPSSPTIPLSIRFYNGTTIASSTFYNVVSDNLWLWKTPATPPAAVTMSLNDTGLQWLSIAMGGAAGTAFHTTIINPAAIPEPSTVASMILGGGALSALVFARARRRSKS